MIGLECYTGCSGDLRKFDREYTKNGVFCQRCRGIPVCCLCLPHLQIHAQGSFTFVSGV